MKAFLLWVIKNVRFAALIIAGIILGTCFIKMWRYGDVFSTEYLITYINSNVAYASVWQEVLSYRLRRFVTLAVFMITPFRKLYVYWLCLYNGWEFFAARFSWHSIRSIQSVQSFIKLRKLILVHLQFTS